MADPMDIETKEQRGAQRQKTFLQGRVFFNNRRSSIDCVIRDLSDSGARLKFATMPVLPEVFELNVPYKDEWFRAQIIWHDGTDLGVTLAAVKSPAPNERPGLDERVAKLETELVLLKRRLDEIMA